MATHAERLKAALDHIGSAFSGIRDSISSINANLAALRASAAQPDPLLEAAASEAEDLDRKMTAFAEGMKDHHDIDIVQTSDPANPNLPPPNAAPAKEPEDGNVVAANDPPAKPEPQAPVQEAPANEKPAEVSAEAPAADPEKPAEAAVEKPADAPQS